MAITKLKTKLKLVHDDIPEIHAIRLHRAISWLQAATEQENNPDLKLVCLWIAWNSCYAVDDEHEKPLSEKERFRQFIDKLVQHDKEGRIYNLLWNNYSGAVRVLLENQYVYAPFWDYHRGEIKEWKKQFELSVAHAHKHLSGQNVSGLLQILMDRLYTLRNQVVHGGSTYQSKVNRLQIKDGCNILASLLPVFIDIMMESPAESWGKIYYPPV